ncbi:hypothetical protein EU528_03515 [Candidatus Thorarchaeota archaeon]|nr:MAG: hypothetical protein EU528_03515 [Candidatus Thorarchaeota archaeon]
MAVCTVFFVGTITSAHIPIVPEDGTTLATATEIIDPWKSWFYYSEIAPGDSHYYSFEAMADERIRFMVNVPLPEGDRGFLPTFILMGPGISNQGTPDASIEIPSGAEVMVIESSTLEPEFEGFTPLSQYKTVDLNMSAPETGTYYIAIYDGTIGGRYALVTGYVEAYSITGWIAVPLDAMIILQWSGQNLFLILLPMFIPLILGLFFLVWRHRSVFNLQQLPSILGTMGGLMFLGSSLSFFTQMVLALLYAPYNWTIIATIIFITIPLLLGVVTLMITHKENWIQKKSRLLSLIIIGIIAPFVWAGLFIGPIFVIVAGIIPMIRNTST